MVTPRGIGRTARRSASGESVLHDEQVLLTQAPLLSLTVLLRDRKPQESESEEDEQGLKDEVHLCIRQVMEAKDPMDPDDIEAQDEAGAREHAQKRMKPRSLAWSKAETL